MRRRRSTLLWLALVAALALALVLSVGQPGRGPRWRALRAGIEFTTLRGEPFCRHGSSRIAVLRLDPARARLRVLHYTQQPERRPLGIVEWQRRTGALVVFNAGQYYPDYSYMGLLVSAGVAVSPRLHPGFQAALVASPAAGGPGARVLDLAHEPLDPDAPGWGEVAQSFMLFGRDGELRVRRGDHVANRTAVGEDRRGRLVVLASEGGYTLWDFARWLQLAPLELRQAMAMDGGLESELCVSAGRFRYASFGHWDGGAAADAPRAQTPLPAVVAVNIR